MITFKKKNRDSPLDALEQKILHAEELTQARQAADLLATPRAAMPGEPLGGGYGVVWVETEDEAMRRRARAAELAAGTDERKSTP